jgi:hypothetical protein
VEGPSPLSTIRNQLKLFERTLKRVLAFATGNSLNHIKTRKPMSGSLKKSASLPGFRKSLYLGEVMTRYQYCYVLYVYQPKYKLLKLFLQSFSLNL